MPFFYCFYVFLVHFPTLLQGALGLHTLYSKSHLYNGTPFIQVVHPFHTYTCIEILTSDLNLGEYRIGHHSSYYDP